MYSDHTEPCSDSRELLTSSISQQGTSQAIKAATLRAIVRGEQPAGDLNGSSVRGNACDAEWAITNLLHVSLFVRAADLAEGIVNLKENPAALVEWARFVLVISELFDFEDEQSDHCERLVSCIWGFAFGAPLTDQAIRLASVVRSQFFQA